jgi:chromosomal replication initiation ATPase DnaA
MPLSKTNFECRKKRIETIKQSLSTYIQEYETLLQKKGLKKVKPIIEAFCIAFNVDKDMVPLPVRYGNIIACRHGLCYYLYKIHRWNEPKSLHDIGCLTDVVPPDHTTVLYRINTFKNWLQTDEGIRQAYNDAVMEINSRFATSFTSLKYKPGTTNS